MSDKKTIQEILFTTTKLINSNTRFEESNDLVKRQFVVSALLELYRAEALGDSNHSLHNNLARLDEHTNLILATLKGE